MPVTLKLLGGMVLENSDGLLSGQITQRRRLAFLAVLGAGQRDVVSRDRLVALLWPELDAEGARHRLSDSLYVARRALGEGAIVPMGDDLRLDDAHVDVDVRAFERALDAGETEQAVELYRGPFLDGFHLGGDGEFDRWIDDERARLASRYLQALRTLAASAEQRGDYAAAAEWLRRLATHDPLDARVTLQLMKALDRSGNGAAALRHARVHQTLRQSELGLSEEPSIRAASDALAERLERGWTPQVEPAADHASEGLRHVAESSAAPAVDAPLEGRRVARRWPLFAAIAGVSALIVMALVYRRDVSASREPRTPISAATETAVPAVAVFPFLVRGGDSTDIPGDALASLISTKLDGGAGLRSIDPNALLARYHPSADRTVHPDPADAARLARDLGARYFVLGDVVRASGHLHLGAALYDAATGTAVESRIGVEGKTAAFFDLVDSLAARLLVDPRGQPVPQLAKLASLTTSSLPALKLYLDGESLARDGRFAEAAERFERAAAEDTAFGLAYYRLAWAHEWIPGSGSDIKSLENASRYAARLPERIRLTLEAALVIGRGDTGRGEAMLRGVVARYPDDFDANCRLGDLLFHRNPYRGRSSVEAREPLERASRLSPAQSAESILHLITIAEIQHRIRDADSLATLFLGLQSEGSVAIGVRAMLAVTHSDAARFELTRRALASLRTQTALQVIGVVQASTTNQEAVARLLTSLDGPTRTPAERAQILMARARVAGADGAWQSADSLFGGAAMLDPVGTPIARARFLTLPSLDPPATALREANIALVATRPVAVQDVARAEMLGALLSMRLGDLEPARVAGERYFATAPNDFRLRALWLEVSARRLLRLGKADQALALFVGPNSPRPDLPLRFLRAEVLEALNRRSEALAWYDVSAQDYGGESYFRAIARAHTRLENR